MGVTSLSCSAKRDRKRPLLRSLGKKRRLCSFISGLSAVPEIFPLLFIMKKCYIIGRNSNFLAINWS